MLIPSLLLCALAASAQQEASPAERALLQLANQARADHSLPPLAWDSGLARAARLHAAWLVREPGDLEHQYPGEPDLTSRASHAGARFATVSENLARKAQTPAQLQQVWMSTPVHRENLLSPTLNAVGIGVLSDRGLLYAVEDFARTVPTPRRDDVEREVTAALHSAGLAQVDPSSEARALCAAPSEAPTGPTLIVRWDGSDPGRLPPALRDQLSQRTFRSAAVGACPSPHPQPGFITYSVAVLLY